MSNLHAIETVRRHGTLLAEYAMMTGAYEAYRGADDNPYTEHLRKAREALPKRISQYACIAAEARLRERGCGNYAQYAWRVEAIRPRNYAEHFSTIAGALNERDADT